MQFKPIIMIYETPFYNNPAMRKLEGEAIVFYLQ